VSPRRNASLVVALGVASLAATSLAAMVATSELLVESFGRPVSGRLEPSAPDLNGPGVIQVEPPERGRGKSPGGRPPSAAAGPPPRRRSTLRPPAEGGARPEAAGDGAAMATRWRPARQERPAVLGPTQEEPTSPPAPRPIRPPHPPARPGNDPGGGSPCPDHPRRDDDRRGGEDRDRDDRRHRHHRDAQRPDRDRSRSDHGRHRRDDDRGRQAKRDRAHDRHHRRHCHRHHEPDRH
jgi:hypothetical protein